MTPPVLLVHGFASSCAHTWEQTGWIDLLGDAGREVIGVDMLGHGNAPRPHDPDAYADVEGPVRDAIAAHDQVDAIGFSAGARMVLTLAAADPAKFRKIVVIGLGANLFRNDDPGPILRALEGEPGAADVGGQLFARLADTAGNDRAALAAFMRRPAQPLTAGDLQAITCPVLVVMGDNDFAGPPEPLVEALPNSALTVLRSVDHFGAVRDVRCIEAALDFIDAGF